MRILTCGHLKEGAEIIFEIDEPAVRFESHLNDPLRLKLDRAQMMQLFCWWQTQVRFEDAVEGREA